MLETMTVLDSESLGRFTVGKNCLLLVYKKICPHCKELKTVIEKCLPAYPDLAVAGIDSEENLSVLKDLGVSKVPTVLIYKDGVPAARRAGVTNPSELSALIGKARAH
jgi:thioredoxin 1